MTQSPDDRDEVVSWNISTEPDPGLMQELAAIDLSPSPQKPGGMPTPAQVWKHFKGGTYTIVLCPVYPKPDKINDYGRWLMQAKWSSSQEVCHIYMSPNGHPYTLTLDGPQTADPSVVYCSHSTGELWLRPLEEFLELVDHPEIPYNGPRFWLQRGT